ncbi:MAG: hypothetical protein GAK45_02063 [Pseudomonas citronellolis]|nr:MAG: hypothetical protein GAK45_02063 [Pseudomonas citronellolis]
MLGQRAEHLEVIHVAPVPAANGAFRQSQFTVDHPTCIEELLHTQTIAGGAGASRVVEGEQLRLQLADRVAAHRAGEARGEDQFLAFGLAAFIGQRRDQGDTVGQVQCGLEGLRQALLEVGTHLETVHHHIDGVFLLLVELGQFVQLVELAVDPSADEALRAHLFEHRQVLALAFANHRGQQHQPSALRQRQHLVDHLADGLCLQRNVVIRATRNTHAGVQQAQVIVDLGDGAHGRTRVVRGGFLLDGNGRGKTFDGVHIGFFHHRQELPGVGRQRFHIASLAFGIERIEGQRRLARAGQAGDHDQLVTG